MKRACLFLALAATGCAEEKPPAPEIWKPGTVYATSKEARRGLIDLRGLVHAHSIYSHDACDNEPVKNGVRDQACFDDFRRGLCLAKHDFVMLTDHRDAFADTEFPEAVLYRADRGDELVDHGAGPVASFASCPDGSRALILAGSESGTLPVGLEGHVEGDAAARGDVYSRVDAGAIRTMQDRGAVVLVAHTEDWTIEQLTDLPLEGFEMYNLHANALRAAGVALEMLLLNTADPSMLPQSDLFVLPLFSEDERYLSRWGSVLARGSKRVTTMGTDCHQNTFQAILPDGERGDSYRRMMIAFSNHLLVREGDWDDRSLKEALRAGRLYGVFESAGYPVGFDFHAATPAGVVEMGGEAPVGATLVLKKPALQNADPAAPPSLTLRILKAREGGFDEVASATEDELRFTVTSTGAYRAEVRMLPLHLRGMLGKYEADVLAKPLPWIYSNAIYVR